MLEVLPAMAMSRPWPVLEILHRFRISKPALASCPLPPAKVLNAVSMKAKTVITDKYFDNFMFHSPVEIELSV